MSNIKFDNIKENLLLHREEVRFTLTFAKGATPTRDQVREIIAKNLKADKELVIVERIVQDTGRHQATGYSKVYKNRESAMLYEPDYELFRNGLKTKEEGAS